MTNALGNGPAAVNSYTGTNDSGLRTNGGGQFSFQITGYLAIQTGAAPISSSIRPVGRDIYAVLMHAIVRSGSHPGTQRERRRLRHDAVRSRRHHVLCRNGFGLPAFTAGDQLSLDVDRCRDHESRQ